MKAFREIFGALLLATMSIILGFLIGSHKNTPNQPEIIKVDTLTIRDTIVENKTIYSKILKTELDTVYLHVIDTVEGAVEIPIDSYVAGFDDARVWFHGYSADIDSIAVYPETKYVVVEKQVKTPRSRWSAGATIGPSVLVTPSGSFKAGIGITAGLSYRF